MDLKTYLQEVALQEMTVLLKEGLSGFALVRKLESIKDPKQTFDYLNRTLGHPKQGGQARVTYPLDKGMVIKFAYDGAYDQNESEVRNSLCLGPDYAVSVIHHHPEFWWLVEERVEIFHNPNDFNEALFKVVGIRLTGAFDFPDAIQCEIHEKISDKAAHINEELKQSPWYQELITRLKRCNVAARDFTYANWGIRSSSGELVLLDLGF